MTIHFPDVSHYQSGLSLTGAPAVIAKASQGAGMRDGAYRDFHDQADALGIPFVGYHWVTGDDLDAQAHNCYGACGPTPVMWDAEAAGATVTRVVDLTKRLRQLGGNPRLVYLPHWWWRDHLGSPDLRPLADVGLSLISSQYPDEGYTETGPGWASYGGMSPVIWQYTDAHSFNGMRVDFNAYRGTAGELADLLGVSTVITDEDALKVAGKTLGSGVGPGGVSPSLSGASYGALDAAQKAAAGVQQLLDRPAGEVDVDALAAALVPKVIDGLVNSAAFLSAVANAVNDDTAERLAT